MPQPRLGQYQDPRSVQPLIRALKDSDRSVRIAATTSLTALGELADPVARTFSSRP